MTGLLIVAALLVLIVLGVPIGFALGLSGALGLLLVGMVTPVQIALATYSGLESFALVAIPMFLLMANLMDESGVTTSLVALAQALVGRIRGSLAVGTVAAGMFMGGISGSSLADTVSVGSIMIPAMKEDGYPPAWAAAVAGAANMVGPIIPPSILMILYGLATNQSVLTLFVAGIVPGVLISLVYGVMAYVTARRHGYGRRSDEFSFKQLGAATIRSVPALVIPAVIIVGVLGGVFTVTESAGIAAGYALLYLLMRAVLTRQPPRDIIQSLGRALHKTYADTSVVAFLVGGSALLAQALTLSGLPNQFAHLLISLHLVQWQLLLILNVFMLIMGMVLEPAASVLIVASLFVPLAQAAHISLIHFGLITVINLQIGTLTPPIGTSGYITSKIAGVGYEEVVGKLIPWIGLSYVLLFLITYVPAITLWLPTLLHVN